MTHTYKIRHKTISLEVERTGTGGGFELFAERQSIINNASRKIKPEEKMALENAGIQYLELPVAADGITVVVSKENSFINSLTTQQLAEIFSENSPYTYWSDINSNWPRVLIDRVGPGDMHGTYDYFVQQTVGKNGRLHNDYRGFEFYNDIATYIADNKYAIGYLGFAHFVKYQQSLMTIAVDHGSGPVRPSFKTISAGEYQPLTRKLYLYVRQSVLSDPQVNEFLTFYLTYASQYCPQAGFIPLADSHYDQLNQRVSITDQPSVNSHVQGER
jgi:phosphate transport system substrate-binding protein